MKYTNNSKEDAQLAQLWQAAIVGDTGKIRRLAKLNIDLDAPNSQGFSAFSLAMQYNHLETAKTIHKLWLASRSGYIPGMLLHGMTQFTTR